MSNGLSASLTLKTEKIYPKLSLEKGGVGRSSGRRGQRQLSPMGGVGGGLQGGEEVPAEEGGPVGGKGAEQQAILQIPPLHS